MILAALFAATFAATPTIAGPPFLTDDPEPTEQGHWEIYAPLMEVSGKGSAYEGSIGTEINYGATRDVQVTLGLPVAFAHDGTRTQWGASDVALSVKYRFYHDEGAGLSIAAFPGLTLPTAKAAFGNGRVTAFLPVWAQKDLGAWTVFGGGGYAINPGEGNQNYWTGGIAVSRQIAPNLLIGVEADREGASTIEGAGATSLGLGAILSLHAPFRVLASGGPTFVDGGGSPGLHAFVAVGLDF